MSKNRNKNKVPSSLPTQEEADMSARVVAIPKDQAKTTEAIAATQGEPKAAPANQSAKPKNAARTDRIGDILKDARQKQNYDLYQVAQYLCIKPSFLIAIENSRYDEIPADAYVIGFLRTYANFLGVNGKDAVDRYRYEMAGRRKKPVLSMPVPMSEGRMPSSIVMAGTTVVLLLLYIGWYAISSSNRAEVNIAPPLSTAEQTTPFGNSSAAVGLTAPVTETTPPLKTETTSAQPTNSAAQPQTKVEPATVAVATTSVSPAINNTTAPTSSAIPPAPLGIVLSGTQPETVITKETVAAVASQMATKPATTETPKTDSATTTTETSGRITIKATQNSWIMIVDDSGRALFDKVLKPGEVYKVPNQQGLSLTTGNGNGIILSVDGVDLPKIASGSPRVVRNIPLDPKRLNKDTLPAAAN